MKSLSSEPFWCMRSTLQLAIGILWTHTMAQGSAGWGYSVHNSSVVDYASMLGYKKISIEKKTGDEGEIQTF